MENITLRAETRPHGTKGQLRALRKRGVLPGVLYGKEVGNKLVQCSERDIERIIAEHSIGGTLINLELVDGDGGKVTPYLVMIREVQRDPIKQRLLHVDFFQVPLNEEIETEIPVHLVGEAPGVEKGGVLQHMLREVTVSCLPSKLPEYLEADISGLDIGDYLTVADLKLPEGVKVLDDPESIIVSIVEAVAEEAEEEEAAEEGAEAATAAAAAAPEAGEE
ncbi:MAG: 50S ribosomal protein L25/general stress protein Ctc [Thermacetogeniaceae bacterium]